MTVHQTKITLQFCAADGVAEDIDQRLRELFKGMNVGVSTAVSPPMHPRDIPVTALQNERLVNRLILNMRIMTISQLVRYSRDWLLNHPQASQRLCSADVDFIEEWLRKSGMPKLGSNDELPPATRLEALVEKKQLSTRACNILRGLGIRTVGQAIKSDLKTVEELTKMPNCGKVSQQEIIDLFDKIDRPLQRG